MVRKTDWKVVLAGVLLVVGGGVLSGCGEESAQVSVELFGWHDGGSDDGTYVERLSDYPEAQEMRVQLTNPSSGEVIDERRVDIAFGGTELPEMDGDRGLRLDFRLYSSEGPIAGGATPEFSVRRAGQFRGYRTMVSPYDAFAPVGSRPPGADAIARSYFDDRQIADDEIGRTGHTVNRTSSGRLLIVGGARLHSAYEPGDHPPMEQAFGDIQVYDPSSGLFTELAADDDARDAGEVGSDRLHIPRAYHTVTPLGNNRFLVVGGFGVLDGQTQPTNFVELIDLRAPAGQRVQQLSLEGESRIEQPRGLHTATLRDDGTVVIAGGIADSSADIVGSVEIIDPDEETLRTGVSMDSPRSGHSAVLLEDGETVWLVGGGDSNGDVLASTELVTPGDLTTQEGPKLNRGRSHAAAFHMGEEANNLVVIIGGFTAGGATSSYEFGNPEVRDDVVTEEDWTIDQARGDFELFQLDQSGDLVLIGGYDPDRQPVRSAERFRIQADSVPPLAAESDVGSMVGERGGAGAAKTTSGGVLVVGGIDAEGMERADAEYFNPDDPVD